MTKAQEMEIFMEAIDKLGPNSYLGPALNDLVRFVDSDIRCDFVPDLAGMVDDLLGRKNVLEKEVIDLTLRRDALGQEIGILKSSLTYNADRVADMVARSKILSGYLEDLHRVMSSPVKP